MQGKIIRCDELSASRNGHDERLLAVHACPFSTAPVATDSTFETYGRTSYFLHVSVVPCIATRNQLSRASMIRTPTLTLLPSMSTSSR